MQSLKTDDNMEQGVFVHGELKCKMVETLGRTIWQHYEMNHVYLKHGNFTFYFWVNTQEISANTYKTVQENSQTAMAITYIVWGYIYTHRYEYMHMCVYVFLKVLEGYTLNLWIV